MSGASAIHHDRSPKVAANPLRKILSDMAGGGPRRPVTKTNRTFSLSEPNAWRFIAFCNYQGRTASEIVDRLIADFLEEAKNEMPTDEELEQFRIRRKTSD